MSRATLFLGIIFLGLTSFKANAEKESPIGSWMYFSHNCRSGAIPNPNLDQSIVDLTISESYVTYSGQANSCFQKTGPIAITIAGDKIDPHSGPISNEVHCPDKAVVANEDGVFRMYSFVVKSDRLALSVRESEFNSICPKGDIHTIEFRRSP